MSDSTSEPSVFWTRLRAVWRGEVSADALEAYRRAGSTVYDLLDRAERRRGELAVQGKGPWTADQGTQAFFALTWNAYALQLLGDAFLEADYEADPATIGFVPPVTAEQAVRLYAQVPDWLARASQAEGDPSYRLDVALPAEMPPWHQVEPCPRAHLAAMREAASTLRRHAEAARADFQAEPPPSDGARATTRVAQLFADVAARADYSERLWAPTLPQAVHEDLETQLKLAIEGYYQLGQLMAMPALADRPAAPPPGQVRRLPGPGEVGFDPWCLTDPDIREGWSRERLAQQAIDHLWRVDPDPRQTLASQAEINAAQARGDVAYAQSTGGARLGHYFCCPWGAIYVVRRPLVLGGRPMRVLEQFAYDVSGEEMEEGGPFVRRIVVGDFRPTTEVDYCLPGSGH